MKTLTILLLLLLGNTLFGQITGNSVIDQNYSNLRQPATNKIYLSDSTFVVQANVLTNIIADSYVAVFGVSESAKTLAEANTNIDKRIQDFISALTKTGIAKDDIFVDMTTQTQLADYKITGNYAEQFISGFEQKKNVIVKFANIQDLGNMVTLASGFDIYDLVKVDYIVKDLNKIYVQLFRSAMEVINSKKDLYVSATNVKLLPSSQIYGESFTGYYPAQMYKSYTPNVSSELYTYYDDSKFRKKDLKKNTTYYYEKVNYSYFDKVLNPVVTEPAVGFVLTLQLKYEIDK
ncbi:MAG: SIMPL domain-containing protein [Ignavibacteriaceae bacterium]